MFKTPSTFAAGVVTRALANPRKAPKCGFGQAADAEDFSPAHGQFRPWGLTLDLLLHDGVGHWSMFVLLDALSSTKRDWQLLGQITYAVISATGYPKKAPKVEPLVSIAEAHPLAPLVWVWHSDGSAIDPTVKNSLKEAVSILTPRDPRKGA